MKKAWWIGIIIALILIGLIFLLTKTNKETQGYCSANSDCVPASCCHPSSCVAKGQAPSCKGIMCSQSCEPGTLDCMQGSCICENDECKALLK